MVRTGQPGAALTSRVERVDAKPFALSLIKARMRAVAKLMLQRDQEPIIFGGFYVGLGDRFDDDRRRVPILAGAWQTPGSD